MENTNIRRLIKHFQSGNKKDFKLGLELEHFIVDKKTKKTIDYYGDMGVEKVLQLIRPAFDKVEISNNHIIGLANSDYYISLEPAAQFEVSIVRQENIKDIRRIYNDFLELINPVLEEMGYELFTLGYHPVSKIDDLSILPKDRYKHMYSHFQSSGKMGKNMMKGTASTQVSIDYKDEKDFIIKYRATVLLSPILGLITDNAPVFEGVFYHKNMLRQDIWRNVDKARTDFIFDLNNFGFKDYANFIYNVPLVNIPSDGKIEYTHKTPKELYINKEIKKEDIDLIMSMVFPDVRLKTYIEIRVADSIPFEYVQSYLALIKGIFIDSDSLDLLIGKLDYKDFSDIEEAKSNLSNFGFLANVYGKDVPSIIKEMISLAKIKLNKEEQDLLNPLIDLVNNQKTLSQIYKEREARQLCNMK